MRTHLTTSGLALALVALVWAPVVEAQQQEQQQRSATRAAASAQGRSTNVNALVEDFVLVQLAEKAWVGGDFTVKADDGHVTIRGTVPTESTKARIGRIARDTVGVTEVSNELRVEPWTASAGSAVPDDQLSQRVARRIAAALPGAKTGEDWWLEGWRVEGPDNAWNFVVDADGGRIHLGGDVPRLSIIRKAIDAARQTTGVQSVRSDLELDRFYDGYRYGYRYGYPGAYPYGAYPYSPYPAYGYHPWAADPEYFARDIEVPGGAGQGRATGEGQRLSGRVTAIDQQSGRVTLQTDSGTLQMTLPPSALGDVQRGDRVTLQIGAQASSPAASPGQPGAAGQGASEKSTR